MSSRKKRAYASPLRASQRRATRDRILDGALEGGVGELSVPELARRTGISVPTIYRHFPSRAALLKGVVERVDALVKMREVSWDPNDLGPAIKAFVEQRYEVEDRLGDAAQAPVVWEIRRTVTVPRRRAFARDLVAGWAPALANAERRTVEDLLVVLFSATTITAFRKYLGCSPDETAARLTWMVEAVRARAAQYGTADKKVRAR